jgi:hypothetical protein
VLKDKDGKTVLDANGNAVFVAKYTGLHALRHFFASWCINRKIDGGLELPPTPLNAWWIATALLAKAGVRKDFARPLENSQTVVVLGSRLR